MMAEIEYICATDFDRAWLNFELDLPLDPNPGGQANPFYVNRPDNPTVSLERQLLRPYNQPPKYFFSGHRGCGKSTELRRLAINPRILAKYWPVNFTIQNEANLEDLDFKDVLVAIGARLFCQYHQPKEKRKLPDELLEQLNSWYGEVQIERRDILAGRSETEIEAGIETFFAKIGSKMRVEPTTRKEMRQVFDRRLSELIDVINQVAATIFKQEGRSPLMLIDDLDKPNIDRIRTIFCHNREAMLWPEIPIVYTVPSSLFYSSDFEAIRDRAIFLPNVKLHPHGQPDERHQPGYDTMQAFVQKRMDASLIEQDALDAAIWTSGGLFREMCRIMRSAIDHALDRQRERIELDDVRKAEAEIRSEYQRILTQEQRTILRSLRTHNRYDEPEKIAPLMQMLAALEYKNDEVWCDIHPALYKLVDEE
jgi:hypothetical protein